MYAIVYIAGIVLLGAPITVMAAERDQIEVQEAMARIGKPATSRDLLGNIKLGMEQNLFLREGFYTEGNIRRVLGDYDLRWETNDPARKYVAVAPSKSAASGQASQCISAAVLSWLIKTGNGPASLAKLQFAVSLKHGDPGCASFSADLIQGLFGKPTKVENIFSPGPPPPHGRNWVPSATTHPLGNTDVEYVFGEGKLSKRMTFEIRGDGVAIGFSVFMEQN